MAPVPPRPFVVVHVAVGLDGAARGLAPDLGRFYALAATWDEDVTLAGSGTILAQEDALVAAPPGPGPDPAGPLLAVVDSGRRVRAWEALRAAGHWRDAVPLRGPGDGPVDLAAALAGLAADGDRTVRVDSGGRLIGALLRRGLVDEVSLLVHPAFGDGSSWNDGAVPALTLRHHERCDGGLLWLRFAVGA